jgi:hypothetical protein
MMASSHQQVDRNGQWHLVAAGTYPYRISKLPSFHVTARIQLISFRPPKSTFALEGFSFACVSGVPQAECAISVWGWKGNGKVIKRTIKFPELGPAPIEAYAMNKTVFSHEWRDLKSVGFSIARANNGGDMYGGLALDDVKYTVTYGCP